MDINKIPQDLKDAIFSQETFKKLQDFWYRHKLDKEQQKALGGETGLYMSGETKADRFVPNLMYRMDISRAVAEEIKERVDQEIIEPVRESFEKAQRDEVTIKPQKEEIEDAENQIPQETQTPEHEEEFTVDLEPEIGPEAAPEQETTQPIIQDIPGVNIEEDSRTIPTHSENASVAPYEKPEEMTKNDVLKEVERTNNTEKVENDSEYGNYAPLNVIKNDVLKGIEDPDIKTEETMESKEGTELDSKLDQILKKPRHTEIPQNLPTEPGEKQPEFEEKQQAQEVPQKPTPPSDRYKPGEDPYREPVE